MFCIGIPFSNITLMAPFVILGVGLDDTFIITGAYFRRCREEILRELDQSSQSNAPSIAFSMSGRFDESKHSESTRKRITAPRAPGECSIASSEVSPITHAHDDRNGVIILERVRLTLEEVGTSISLTTITTTTAFVLGCISTIPAIRWLCLCK